jgi:hypothetical protein
MKRSSVYDCHVIPLNKTHTFSGSTTVVEGNRNVPFNLRRIYYLYDIPGGESRGGHAHKKLQQLIVAASGSFEVLLDDGENKKIIRLDRPNFGLLVIPGIWRELMEFSSGAICIVLASHKYNKADYMRNYNSFVKFKKRQTDETY